MGRINLPELIYPGAIVRVMDWVGVVLSVEGDIVTLESPKRVVFTQSTLDKLDYSLAPWLWQPATMEDLINDAVTQRAALTRAKRRKNFRHKEQRALRFGSLPSTIGGD